MKKNSLFTFLLSFLPLLISCNPLDKLRKEIKNYGYIYYTTPLTHAGPGTLIGGSPKALSIVASPETCFPKELEEVQKFYKIDTTTIPTKTYRMRVGGSTKFRLLDFLGGGATPHLRGGVRFNIVETMSLEMKGIHIEYLDSILLTEYYRSSLSEICKDYLDRVGFIIQALKVDELVFEFYRKDGGKIDFEVENIEQILDLSLALDWDIQESTKLVIDSPKYIGYQLGSLRREHEGMALFRASKVSFGKFIFKPITLFDVEKRAKAQGRSGELVEEAYDFVPLDEIRSIDRHSIYRLPRARR